MVPALVTVSTIVVYLSVAYALMACLDRWAHPCDWDYFPLVVIGTLLWPVGLPIGVLIFVIYLAKTALIKAVASRKASLRQKLAERKSRLRLQLAEGLNNRTGYRVARYDESVLDDLNRLALVDDLNGVTVREYRRVCQALAKH
ncbi:MAG: hypothetical protein RDU25_00765 [Patescibacteria group bacterium]|nr:hypothetical protein [Patescibacteria group bacterium]